MTKMQKYLVAAVTLLAVTVFAIYGEAPYYGRAFMSHRRMVYSQELITTVVSSKRDLPGNLEEKLALVPDIVSFATGALRLKNKAGSYQNYVDVGKAVAWNVILAPEFSLEARLWCKDTWLHRVVSRYIGCFSFRGFPTEGEANSYASIWKKKGYDVHVSPVRAYSTRGFDSDPVVSSMLRGSRDSLAELIFHELAHSTLYYKDSTAIDESFATAVAEIGVCRFLRESDPEGVERYAATKRSERLFTALLLRTRKRLESLYAENWENATAVFREKKEAIFDMLREEARSMGLSNYSAFLANGLNNAKVAGISAYLVYGPGFLNLFAETNGNMDVFFQEVRKLFVQSDIEKRLANLASGPERAPCDFTPKSAIVASAAP